MVYFGPWRIEHGIRKSVNASIQGLLRVDFAWTNTLTHHHAVANPMHLRILRITQVSHQKIKAIVILETLYILLDEVGGVLFS